MLPHALLLAAVIIWGWTFVATKILVAELAPIEVFALRLALGLPTLGVVMLVRRVRLRLAPDDVRPLLASGAIFATHFLVQIAGLTRTTATNTGWLISITPLVLAAVSAVAFRERIGRYGIAGIVVATLGVLALVTQGDLTSLRGLRSVGDWLIVLSAFTWALYTIASRHLSRRLDPVAATFGILIVASALMVVPFFTVADMTRIRSLSLQGLLALLYLAIPGLALAQWFWQEGVARIGPSRAGLYLYVEPLATVALAIPLLRESIGPAVLIGGSLILAGVYVGQRRAAG